MVCRIPETDRRPRLFTLDVSPRASARDWVCAACGACGIAPEADGLGMVECDDCGTGEVEWEWQDLETRGFSVSGKPRTLTQLG